MNSSKVITIINSDCLSAMKDMSDKAFDLAIVDPPYGIGEDGKSNHSRSGPPGFKKRGGAKNTKGRIIHPTFFCPKTCDKEPPPPEYFKELQRVSANQIIFGAHHFISRIPLDSPCWIVLDKINSGDFADCELAWTSFKTAVRQFRFMWNGMLQGDMAHKEKRIHPTQKSVALYKWILAKYTKPGQTILDTHLGSGSIAIACHDLGFDLTGYEIDQDYYNAAKERLERHQRQEQLFIGDGPQSSNNQAVLL